MVKIYHSFLIQFDCALLSLHLHVLELFLCLAATMSCPIHLGLFALFRDDQLLSTHIALELLFLFPITTSIWLVPCLIEINTVFSIARDQELRNEDLHWHFKL